MSADWSARTPGCEGCGCGGHDLGEWNLTYNLSRMLGEAGFAGWSAVVGNDIAATGRSVTAAMEPVLAELKRDPAKYKAMNPANGWGSYDQAVRVISECLDVLRTNPDAVVSSWL